MNGFIVIHYPVSCVIGQYPNEQQEDFYERRMRERERDWVSLCKPSLAADTE